MTSTLTAVRDQIVTDWEALTPPGAATPRYRAHLGRSFPDGASADRMFRFDEPGRGSVQYQSSALLVVEYVFNARLRLSSAGQRAKGRFDATAHEALLLKATVVKRETWPTGVRFVTTEDFEVIDVGSEDRDVVIPIRALVEETDG